MFTAAAVAFLPLSRRATISLLVMGLGYALHARVQSYSALLAVAILGSLGFHNWMPLQTALGLALTDKRHSGRVLGSLNSVANLASIVGMAIIASLVTAFELRSLYIVGDALMVAGGLLVSRIPAGLGERRSPETRFLLKRRYWLHYVLTFLEGSRTQVFFTFGTLILVQEYGLTTPQVSLLLALSGLVNFTLAPRLARLLDVGGERTTLSASYVALALCFVGYGTVNNVRFLALMLIAINLLVTLRIGLSSYVNRIAPPDELMPALSAGVSINHISSVTVSLLAGTLLSLVGYERLSWGAAVAILLSVPFALAIRIDELGGDH
jgi:predicted MFS family arabinose efflux permease